MLALASVQQAPPLPAPLPFSAQIARQIAQACKIRFPQELPAEPPPDLTSSPEVAAGARTINDTACIFPTGEYWAVDPENAARWYRHKFRKEFHDEEVLAAMGNPWLDELFELRLDLLYFATYLDDPRWQAAERTAALVLYLLPGREHWGTFLPPLTDEECEDARIQAEIALEEAHAARAQKADPR